MDGNVVLAGTQVCGRTPEHTFRLGAVLVPEREKVFSKLTVEEHLRLVSPALPAAEDLVFQPLAALWESRAGLLSGGERQMLAMEMAWCSAPRLLLADEVSLAGAGHGEGGPGPGRHNGEGAGRGRGHRRARRSSCPAGS